MRLAPTVSSFEDAATGLTVFEAPGVRVVDLGRSTSMALQMSALAVLNRLKTSDTEVSALSLSFWATPLDARRLTDEGVVLVPDCEADNSRQRAQRFAAEFRARGASIRRVG